MTIHFSVKYVETRSQGALRAPTSRLRPFSLALGPLGLLDNVLNALRALRPCDQCPARVGIGSSRSGKRNENLVHSFREVKSEIKIWFTHFENEK